MNNIKKKWQYIAFGIAIIKLIIATAGMIALLKERKQRKLELEET